MRQSRKEREIERLANEAIPADRREAMTFGDSVRAEFADEFGLPGGFRGGRRDRPGGRG
ncbi:hypothetical protein [Cohnella caldifontis]|uniref:hypothetical protein n=1 Tax=Cohnella caldifontis TaxID=3027471 RepID=UPI0023EBEAA6|nr:hypothetical protein [Cohnella sp. YIM B05605]